MDIQQLFDAIKTDDIERFSPFVQSTEEIQLRISPEMLPNFALPADLCFNCPMLSICVHFQSFNCIDFLLDRLSNDQYDEWGMSPTHLACKNGFLAFLTNEKRRFDFNSRDWKGKSALDYAIIGGHLEIVHFLIDQKGFDVNSADKLGYTPLSYAFQNGQYEIAQYLISKSAVLSTDNMDVGHIATVHDQDTMLPLLPAETLDHKDENQRTYLHHAAISNSSRCIVPLVDLGLDINLVDAFGMAPLHYAAQQDARPVIEVIVKIDAADRDVRNKAGQNALHVAAAYGAANAVECLIASAPELGRGKDGLGRTPLHTAAIAGKPGIVNKLVAAYPDEVATVDSAGKTPSDLVGGPMPDVVRRKLPQQQPTTVRQKTTQECAIQ